MTPHEKDQSFFVSNDSERSDPEVNTDALPHDHPIHLFPEAQEHYGSDRPPFVLNRRSEVTKTVVIPTRNGFRPKDEKATKVKIVAKPWGKDFMFWTLDLNNTRYIVKPFNGGAGGGMRYLYWAGPGKDFEEKPLAVSYISPSQPGAPISIRDDDALLDRSSFFAPINRKRSNESDSFESSDSSDSSDTSDSEAGGERARTTSLAQHFTLAGTGETVQQIDDSTSDRADHHASKTNALQQQDTFQGAPAKRRKTEVSSRELEQLYRVSPPARRRSDAHLPIREVSPESEPLDTSISRKPANDREEKRKQGAITRIENHLDRPFDEVFTPWAGEDQDVSRNTLQMILKVISLMEECTPQRITRTLNKALNGGDGKRQPAGGKKPTRPYFKELAATIQSTKPATVNDGRPDKPSPPSGSNHQQLDQKKLQRPEPVGANGPGPLPQSNPAPGNHHQRKQDLDLDLLPSTVLSQQKQTRTTMAVRKAPFLEFTPLKLNECMTPQAFYTNVLAAVDFRGESMVKMTVTFTWMDPNDKMRTMAMNSKIDGCFAHLLEQVDEAPVWEDKGKCLLDVDVVMKE